MKTLISLASVHDGAVRFPLRVLLSLAMLGAAASAYAAAISDSRLLHLTEGKHDGGKTIRLEKRGPIAALDRPPG